MKASELIEVTDTNEESLRKEMERKAKTLGAKVLKAADCSFDFDWADTGDDTWGIDAYFYFYTKMTHEDTGIPLMEFPDGEGLVEDKVRECVNLICRVADPEFDYDRDKGHGMEFELGEDWVRVYVCLTVPDAKYVW